MEVNNPGLQRPEQRTDRSLPESPGKMASGEANAATIGGYSVLMIFRCRNSNVSKTIYPLPHRKWSSEKREPCLKTRGCRINPKIILTSLGDEDNKGLTDIMASHHDPDLCFMSVTRPARGCISPPQPPELIALQSPLTL